MTAMFRGVLIASLIVCLVSSPLLAIQNPAPKVLDNLGFSPAFAALLNGTCTLILQ
jgi:hypothetical protein